MPPALSKDQKRSKAFYEELADALDDLIADSIVVNSSSSVTNLSTELRAYRNLM